MNQNEENDWNKDNAIDQIDAHPGSLRKKWQNGERHLLTVKNLKEEISKFVKHHYSSNITRIQFYSKLSFEEMVTILNTHFSRIPNHKVHSPVFTNFKPEFD